MSLVSNNASDNDMVRAVINTSPLRDEEEVHTTDDNNILRALLVGTTLMVKARFQAIICINPFHSKLLDNLMVVNPRIKFDSSCQQSNTNSCICFVSKLNL